jgi:hypothetical protein
MQNVFKRNHGFLRDIDVFAHTVRCRFISNGLGDFTDGSEQRGILKLLRTRKPAISKETGKIFEPA